MQQLFKDLSRPVFGIAPVPSVKKVASYPQHLLSHHLTGFDLITTDVESTPSKTCDWPENKDLKNNNRLVLLSPQ